MRNTMYLAGTALALTLGGCIDAYMPDVVEAPNSYLVVDGFINGAGRTRIRLTRSTNIALADAPPAVRGALVYIVDNTGVRYQVRESGTAGAYISDSLLLNAGRQYKLRILLGNTGTAPLYESELVPLKVTPPFDLAALVQQDDQFQLRVSTHDDAARTQFYRWRTYETWEFNALYSSVLETKLGKITPRTTPIYTCWRSETVSTIRQASTTNLSRDEVSRQNVLSFSDHDERLKIRYSVLLTQAAETKEEFAYNEILRKNTEAVGTVNDPLPSQLTGNVHRLNGDTAEPVLGFVSAHTLVQRRLWATPTSLGLPTGWRFDEPYGQCAILKERVPDPDDKYPLHRPYTRSFSDPKHYTPTSYWVDGDTLGYYGAASLCVDCRTRGTTTRPSFW